LGWWPCRAPVSKDRGVPGHPGELCGSSLPGPAPPDLDRENCAGGQSSPVQPVRAERSEPRSGALDGSDRRSYALLRMLPASLDELGCCGSVRLDRREPGDSDVAYGPTWLSVVVDCLRPLAVPRVSRPCRGRRPGGHQPVGAGGPKAAARPAAREARHLRK
jgi:hypothetical protein